MKNLMTKTMKTLAVAGMTIGLALTAERSDAAEGRAQTETVPAPRAPNYADATGKDWLFHHGIAEKKYAGEPTDDLGIDLFYLYPTAVLESNDHTVDNICDIDDAYLRSEDGALGSWKMSGEVFGDFTRVYAPYYRQTPGDFEMAFVHQGEYGVTNANDRMVEYWYERAPYTDVTNALTHYFTVINPDQGGGKRRPFILAGHAHGSGMLRLVMERFFTNETQKAWLANMVACYAVGFGVGKDVETTIKEKAGVPFATNATDTGVYIFWNTQGAGVKPGESAALWPADPAPAVNPITWTREADAYAAAAKNLGGWTTNDTGAIRPGLYDASNLVANGTIVCSSPDLADKYMSESLGFGENSLHFWDYKLYWENVRQNGWTRALPLSGLKKVETATVPTAEGASWKVEVKGAGQKWSEAIKSPVDGCYYVSGSVATDNVCLTYTLDDPSSGKRFVNGETTTSFPMAYDDVKGVWSTTATEADIKAATKTSDKPTVQLGVVAQRYPWNGMLDIQYKTLYANASVSFTFYANGIELGTAKGTGGQHATASFDLTQFDAFKDKVLKSVKITAKLLTE